ncbi:MAG: hypothetical protein IPL11_03805 [Candidatus Accumulibacter sp.]|nr:hypothetical protein [Accumulibacter sp.]
MSRLVEQTLIIKNPFSSSQANNRQLFREHVAALFNDHQEFSGAMVFFDSEAHYPGILDGRFQKICTTHCSSILAAKFDHKLSKSDPGSR